MDIFDCKCVLKDGKIIENPECEIHFGKKEDEITKNMVKIIEENNASSPQEDWETKLDKINLCKCTRVCLGHEDTKQQLKQLFLSHEQKIKNKAIDASYEAMSIEDRAEAHFYICKAMEE